MTTSTKRWIAKAVLAAYGLAIAAFFINLTPWLVLFLAGFAAVVWTGVWAIDVLLEPTDPYIYPDV